MDMAQLSAPVGADEYRDIEERFAKLLGIPSMFVLQGEAILALEAVARGVGRPGVRVLNIVTGHYGEGFGRWLAEQGAQVEDLAVTFDRGMPAATVRAELDAAVHDGRPYGIVSLVHAEAATGAVNPLAEIVAAASAVGALTIVDAVASVGAEPVDVVGLGIDICVLSASKALAGPAGVAGVSISDAGWRAIESNPSAPRHSVLSLLDWRDQWLETDHVVLPVIPGHLETRALGLSVEAVASEGLDRVIARHRLARDNVRAGVRALGCELWVIDDAEAAAVATTVAVPKDIAPSQLVAAARAAGGGSLGHIVGVAPASLSTKAIRVVHTGARATTADAANAVAAIGLALKTLGVPSELEAGVAAALGS